MMDGETRKTEFKTSGGEKLAAALELPIGAPRAYALFAHCFSCSKDIKAAREIARALRAEGFAVLRFDFTGLGASEGDFANTNFSSNVDDLVSAADFLRDEFEAPGILIGHSLGGAAAIVAAERIPEVKGVAVIGAPAEADHVAMQIGEKREEIEKNGVATVTLAGRPFSIKKQFLDDLSNQNVLEHAANLKKPLLIMHAPFDQTVGIENATKIFVAAKHPKSFVSLDTADHLLSDNRDARYAARVLAAWATRYVDAVEWKGAAQTGAMPSGPAQIAPAKTAPVFRGGALAQNIAGEPYAIALSIDGHAMIIDAGIDDGGGDLGPNPTRALEGALAACGAMTVEMYARRKKWDLRSVDIRVKRASSEDSHMPHLLEKEIRLEGDLDQAQRERLAEIADKCPVHRMVTEGVRVRSRIV
jgi:uncharacterized OsmC-like protein/pimeloyl-ACP methyl ester carboxylesterase